MEDFGTLWAPQWTEKSPPEVIDEVRKTSVATPMHVRLSTATTDSLPHAYRDDEVYDTPALHIMRGAWPEDSA